MSAKGNLNFAVKLSVYPLQAVYAACYLFIDRAYVHLDMDSSGNILVSMKGKEDVPRKRLEEIQGEFRNELLHQALRMRISESNQKIREYIVTQALLSAQPPADVKAASAEAEKAPVLDEKLEKEIEDLLAEVEKASEGQDPLNIAVPWEDGSKRKAPEAAGKPEGEAAAAADEDLGREVEKLLDHAEREHQAADPAGGELPWQELAQRVGRRQEPRKEPPPKEGVR